MLRGHRRDIALARGMRATIEDLHSACGTVVNDARTAGPHRLYERDAICIGSTLMVFQNAVQD